MAKAKRILFVAHQGNLQGGADRMLLQLILSLDRTQIDPLVLLPWRASTGFIRALQDAGISYLRWHYNPWINYHHRLPRKLYRLFSNLLAVVFLTFKLWRTDISAVYSNTLYTPLGSLLAWVWRVPHLWHVREFVEEDHGGSYDWGRHLSMQWVNRASKRVICNSKAVEQKMTFFIPKAKLITIYNGIKLGNDADSAAKMAPIPTETYHLGIVGRITDSKGQHEAIEALYILREMGRDVHLHIAGTGAPEYIVELQERVAALGLTEQVTWHGFIDPFTLYKRVHVNLVCSRSEAFGMTVIEAFSVGCPVIGTDSGAFPELLGDDECGLRYRRGDYQALAGQIVRLQDDLALYQRLSKAGYQFAHENFTLARYVNEIQRELLSL